MKKNFITGLKILLVYVVLLLGLEGIGRATIWYLESKKVSGIEAENMISYDEPVVGFALKRNLSEKLTYWDLHTDQWGFRTTGEELMPAKDPNELRIFVVGGSTVFGWRVYDNESVPAHLQKRIDELVAKIAPNTPKKIRVINAGVPWYASWHESAFIFFRVMEFKPDWIIVMDGLNDAASGISPRWSSIYQGYVDLPTHLALEQRKSEEKPSLLGSLLNLSPSFRYFHARLKAKEQLRTGVYRPEVWDQYFAYMKRLNLLTAAMGIRFSIYFQPVMHTDKPLDIFETIHDGTSMREPEFAATFRKEYLEGESRGLSMKGLPFTSLRRAFATNRAPIYLDGLHYNSKGNEILANLIFKDEVQSVVSSYLGKTPPLAMR